MHGEDPFHFNLLHVARQTVSHLLQAEGRTFNDKMEQVR